MNAVGVCCKTKKKAITNEENERGKATVGKRSSALGYQSGNIFFGLMVFQLVWDRKIAHLQKHSRSKTVFEYPRKLTITNNSRYD